VSHSDSLEDGEGESEKGGEEEGDSSPYSSTFSGSAPSSRVPGTDFQKYSV
jgi:hypothetical protein